MHTQTDGEADMEEVGWCYLPALAPLLCTARGRLPLPTVGFPIPRRHVEVSGLHTRPTGAVHPVRGPPPLHGPLTAAALGGRLRKGIRKVTLV